MSSNWNRLLTSASLAAVAVTGVACVPSTDVQCEVDENCNRGPEGQCTTNNTGNSWCTYADSSCASGRRWSNLDVGDGIGGQCVGEDGLADAGSDANEVPDASGPKTVLIAFSAEGSNERVFRVDGDQLVLVWTSPEEQNPRNSQGVAWGHYDSDGIPDLAVAGNGHPSSVFRNNGSTFVEVWNNPELYDYNLAASWSDFDNDGDLDLVLGGLGTRIYRSTGSTLIEEFTTALGSAGLAWGDFDGDGDRDLAICENDTVHLLQYNGSGFTELQLLNDGLDDYVDIAAADFDGDGDTDLAVANSQGVNTFLRNTGSNFAPVFSTLNETSRALAWGDYNGDGLPDLLVANDGPNRLLRNDSGVLVDEWSTPESHESESIAWIDYDSDGDLDFVVANRDAPDQLYRNDDGSFSEVWTSPVNTLTTGVAAVAY